MSKREYSTEITDIVDAYLTKEDLKYDFDEENGVFHFNLTLHNTKLRKITCIIPVGKSSLNVYGICPLNADHEDPAQMARMAEFICRANYGLRPSSFEMDFNDGEIRLKSYIDCDDQLPTEEIIKNSIRYIVHVYKRYTPGILKILFDDMPAKEAVELCENERPRGLRDVLSALGEDPNADLDEVLERLREQLQARREEDGEEADEDSVS